MIGPSSNVGEQTETLVITRVFDAPRDLVFKAFTTAEAMQRWWGPKGFEITVKRFEFRPGGIFHYQMAGPPPDGFTAWGRFVFREIVAPERLVWVNSFSDEAGGLARVPFDDTWPAEMLHTVTLAERGGKTTLTVQVVGLAQSDAERRTFEDGFASMEGGFGGTFDQLADFLAAEQANA
jgi:uncharacterized protein YndB with AHSA1/START domain